GVTVTPSVAAIWLSCPKLAWGSCSQPSTSVCTRAAPPSFDCRCTAPVSRATVSAVVVSTVWTVVANSAIVVIRRLLAPCGGGIPQDARRLHLVSLLLLG